MGSLAHSLSCEAIAQVLGSEILVTIKQINIQILNTVSSH